MLLVWTPLLHYNPTRIARTMRRDSGPRHREAKTMNATRLKHTNPLNTIPGIAKPIPRAPRNARYVPAAEHARPTPAKRAAAWGTTSIGIARIASTNPATAAALLRSARRLVLVNLAFISHPILFEKLHDKSSKPFAPIRVPPFPILRERVDQRRIGVEGNLPPAMLIAVFTCRVLRCLFSSCHVADHRVSPLSRLVILRG